MMMRDSLFPLISNVLERGCGAKRGPTNDERYFVSTDFKHFRTGVMKDSLFLLISNI